MCRIHKLRLPKNLQKNTILSKICEYTEKSSVLFSSIYWKSHMNLRYLIKKQSNCPFIELDWIMYCILRSHARTLIVSGQTLRSQTNLLHNLTTHQHRDIQQIYTLSRQQKQHVVVYTRTMSKSEIRSYINEDYYNITFIEDLLNTQNTDIFQLLNRLVQNDHRPILLELGLKCMKEIIQSPINNVIDLAILTDYDGYLPDNCKGDQMTIDFSSQRYEIWSTNIDNASISENHINSGHQNKWTASLRFTVYASTKLIKQL